MTPLLSILLPTYEYVEGVKKILDNIDEANPNDIEVIIFDDSITDRVNNYVNDYNRKHPRKILYKKNTPSLGAVKNWNYLLQNGNGNYKIILHHDEYPERKSVFIEVINAIKINTSIEFYILNCILYKKNHKIQPHLPNIIRKSIVRNSPTYIFKRNVIGPTSCLVVRRDLYPKFDERLRWFVDVECYYRLLNDTNKFKFLNLNIISTIGREDSITSKLKGALRKIKASERAYLAKKYPHAITWLRPDSGSPLNILESILWTTMRIAISIWYYSVGTNNRHHSSNARY